MVLIFISIVHCALRPNTIFFPIKMPRHPSSFVERFGSIQSKYDEKVRQTLREWEKEGESERVENTDCQLGEESFSDAKVAQRYWICLKWWTEVHKSRSRIQFFPNYFTIWLKLKFYSAPTKAERFLSLECLCVCVCAINSRWFFLFLRLKHICHTEISIMFTQIMRSQWYSIMKCKCG